MKIIYGNNGVGKTYYKDIKQSEGAIVLTSRIDDWTTALNINDSSLEIGQNVNLIKSDIEKIKQHINKLYLNLNITNKQWQDMLKVRHPDSQEGSYWFSKEFWIDSFVAPEINLELNDYHKLLGLKDLINWSVLTEENKNILNEIAFISDKISKTKRKLVDEIIYDSHEIFNSLIEKRNILLQDDFFGGLQNSVVEKLTNISTKNLLDIFSNNGFVYTSDEYANIIKKHIVENTPQEIVREISEALQKLESHKSQRITFNNLEHLNTLEFGELSLVISAIDAHTIKISNSDDEVFLSSGQITMIVSMIIIETATDQLIVFDDVFETLDSVNKQMIADKLKSKENVEILTHNPDLENYFIDKYFEDNEDDEDIDVVEILKIDSQWENVSPSVGTSWNTVIPKIWNKTCPRGKYELNLAKVLARYKAKTGVIQLFKRYSNLARAQRSDTWKHWNEVSNFIFHYNNDIDYGIVNSYFPSLAITMNIDTVSLIELLKGRNLTFIQTDEIIFSITKLDSLFDELLIELNHEKNVFDSFRTECEGHGKWNTRKKTTYNLVAGANPSVLWNRTRTLIHSLDLSPHMITK